MRCRINSIKQVLDSYMLSRVLRLNYFCLCRTEPTLCDKINIAGICVDVEKLMLVKEFSTDFPYKFQLKESFKTVLICFFMLQKNLCFEMINLIMRGNKIFLVAYLWFAESKFEIRILKCKNILQPCIYLIFFLKFNFKSINEDI